MVDTYDIGAVTNDLTDNWTNNNYQEYTVKDLKDDIDNNNLKLGRQDDDPERQDINKLDSNDPDILVKIDTRTRKRASRKEIQLREEAAELEEENNQLQTQLRQLRETRREEQEDLEALRTQLQDVQDEVSDINDEFESLGLTPPVISGSEIANLNQQDKQKANDLLSRRGSLNNRIGNLREQVQEQEQVVETLTEEVDSVRNNINQNKEEIENKRRQADQTPQQTRQVQVIADIIIICTTEYETYISGVYRDPTTNSVTRQIEAKGTKEVIIGARAPENIRGNPTQEEAFWDDVYSQVKQTVFRNPGSFPQGEWFDELVKTMQTMGTAGSQGQFTGQNWEWTFKDTTGTHEFPDEGNELQDEKNRRCVDYIDITMR